MLHEGFAVVSPRFSNFGPSEISTNFISAPSEVRASALSI